MPQYTVFAVYENNMQPYATSVEAEDPDAAVVAAQRQAIEDNGGADDAPEGELALEHGNGYIEIAGAGEYQLAGLQVVEGEVMVVA